MLAATRLKKSLFTSLDRPGGRSVLAWVVTQHFRRAGITNGRFGWDGCWYVAEEGLRWPVDGIADGTYELGGRLRADFAALRAAQDYWCYGWTLRAGDIVVDVGAGRGEDAVFFSKAVGPRGRVIAVEADPVSAASIRRVKELNALPNVEVVQCAVGASVGTLRLYRSDAWCENSVVQESGRDYTDCKSVTLDDLIEGHCGGRGVSYLKMNIEGAERLALAGWHRTVSRVARLTIACHDFRAERGDGEHFRTRGEVCAWLERNGYEVFRRDDDPREYVRDHVHGVRQA